jgi:hypothetical protein
MRSVSCRSCLGRQNEIGLSWRRVMAVPRDVRPPSTPKRQERRDLVRGRQALYRLWRQHCRGQYRPSAYEDRCCRRGADEGNSAMSVSRSLRSPTPITEPVQGEGGFCIAPFDFLRAAQGALRRARHPPCRRRDSNRLWRGTELGGSLWGTL